MENNTLDVLLKQNTDAYNKLSQTIDNINQTMIELKSEIVEQQSITQQLVKNVAELDNRMSRLEDLNAKKHKGLFYWLKRGV